MAKPKKSNRRTREGSSSSAPTKSAAPATRWRVVGAISAAIAMLATATCVLFYAHYNAWSGAPVLKENQSITLIIPHDTAWPGVLELMHEQGLITRPRYFDFWARRRELPRHVKAGNYSLTGPLSLEQLDETLRQGGATEDVLLTIPEGFNIFHIADRVEALGLCGRAAFLDAVRDKVMINDDVFELTEVPESLAVIGAGVIGLELGQALSRLGSSVRVFNINDRVAFFSDDAVRDVALEAFSKEMDFSMSAEITSVREHAEHGDKIVIAWKDADGEVYEQSFSHVLVAAGRRPNVTGMGLEDLELPRNAQGVITTSPCSTQVGDSPIFFAGDVSNHRPLLHEAADEGRIAGYNAARFPDVMVAFRRSKIGVAFTSPQMAFVGARWEELNPDDVVVGEVSYRNQGRARVMLQNEGLVRLYADRRNCRLIGGELLGPRVEHTAHLLTWAIQQEMRVPDILRMPFYHPVVEEGIRTALRDLATKLRVTSHCAPEDFALSPGN